MPEHEEERGNRNNADDRPDPTGPRRNTATGHDPTETDHPAGDELADQQAEDEPPG